MLNKEYIINFIGSIVDNEFGGTEGYGIIAGQYWNFNPTKLEESKGKIIEILKALGVDDKEKISLRDLMTLKDGTVWNGFLDEDDYRALELLVACANACGFLINDEDTELQNRNASVGLTTRYNKSLMSDMEWLKVMKDYGLVDKIFYTISKGAIKEYLGAHR